MELLASAAAPTVCAAGAEWCAVLRRGLLLGCARLYMLSQYHTLAMMNPMIKAVRC